MTWFKYFGKYGQVQIYKKTQLGANIRENMTWCKYLGYYDQMQIVGQI